MKLRRMDWWLGSGLLLIAVAALLAMSLSSKAGAAVVVTYPGGETTLSLHRDGDYSFADHVLIQIKEKRVRFLQSDCPDQICVRSGWLSRSGQSAACLPAGVLIRVIGAGDTDAVV